MKFIDIIGHREVKQQLVEMIQHNRLSHALLFLAKEGNGSLQLAIALAQYLTCESANPRKQTSNSKPSLFGENRATQNPKFETLSDSCGTCSSCIKAQQLIHPDIHFSYPVVTKKSGSPPISTDYISEWREFIKSYPYGNVYDWLQFIGAENKQGNITAQECNDIIRQLNLKSFESEYKILIMWMPEYLGNEGNKLLKLIEEPPPNTLFILVAENESLILPTIVSRCQLIKIEISRLGREKQKQFLRYFNHLLEQAIRHKLMGENIYLPENEMDFADRLNRIADIAQQQAIIEELDKATYYIERNANAKILFHALTIKLYHIIQDKIVFLIN